MAIKLYVDDIRNPDFFVGPGWHWARTVTEAIRILHTQEVSEVSIDHDICHPGTACPETFEPVARFIVTWIWDMDDETYGERYVRARGNSNYEGGLPVTIHTANPTGAENMRQILETFGGHRVTVSVKMATSLEDA